MSMDTSHLPSFLLGSKKESMEPVLLDFEDLNVVQVVGDKKWRRPILETILEQLSHDDHPYVMAALQFGAGGTFNEKLLHDRVARPWLSQLDAARIGHEVSSAKARSIEYEQILDGVGHWSHLPEKVFRPRIILMMAGAQGFSEDFVAKINEAARIREAGGLFIIVFTDEPVLDDASEGQTILVGHSPPKDDSSTRASKLGAIGPATADSYALLGRGFPNSSSIEFIPDPVDGCEPLPELAQKGLSKPLNPAALRVIEDYLFKNAYEEADAQYRWRA